jgi:hypothetical protein
MSYRRLVGTAVLALFCAAALGCQRADTTSEIRHVSGEEPSSRGTATAATSNNESLSRQQPDAEGAVAVPDEPARRHAVSDQAPEPAVVKTANDPPPAAPSPPSIAEKIEQRHDLQQHLEELLLAARSEPTAQEMELTEKIEGMEQVFNLLGEDIANDRANLAQRGLTISGHWKRLCPIPH